jgi:hypothetical protein
VTLMTGFQSRSQLFDRWGEHGGQTIWNNATLKVIFGGFTDAADLEFISSVCGERDTWDKVKGPGGKTRQPRQERLFPPEKVRLLPQGKAIVLHRATRPLIAAITPVWDMRGYQAAPLGPGAFTRVPQTQPALEQSQRQAIPMPAAPVPPAVSDGSEIPDEVRSPEWLQAKDPVTAPSASWTS